MMFAAEVIDLLEVSEIMANVTRVGRFRIHGTFAKVQKEEDSHYMYFPSHLSLFSLRLNSINRI